MRKHDVRKWLHAILDLLPVIIIPVFMIYSHRHTIDNYSIEVPQNEILQVKQNVVNGKPNNTNYWDIYNDDDYENADLTIENGYLTYNVYSNSYYYLYAYLNGTFNDNDIVYLTFYNFCEEQNHDVYYSLGDVYDNFNSTLEFTKYNFRFTITDTSSLDYLYFEFGSSQEEHMYFKNVEVFNLTQMFGSGNEPTIDEFNTYFPNEYYAVDSTAKALVNVGTITYDDTDIGSQMLYCLYNSVDKYFNLNNVFGFNNVYDWLSLNIFNGNPPIAIYIVWNIALYEFLMDLIMLLYALFMWFIDMCENLIDRSFGVVSGRKK